MVSGVDDVISLVLLKNLIFLRSVMETPSLHGIIIGTCWSHFKWVSLLMLRLKTLFVVGVGIENTYCNAR